MIVRLFFILLICALPLTVQAKTHKDVAYGALPEQKLDIYLPDSMTDKSAIILFVHGGGWHIGDKKRVQEKPAAFNRNEHVFISVGYPLLPDHPVEEQAASVAKAIAWVLQNKKNYGIESDKLFLMGHSAGGHLIALVTTDGRYLNNVGLSLKNIQGVIPVDAAGFNIPARMEALPKWRSGARLYKNTFGDDKMRWEALSPYHHVNSQNALPDYLILTAASRAESNKQANDFSKKINDFGYNSVVKPIEDRTHSTINKLMGTKDDAAFAATLEFIEGHYDQ